MKIIRDEKEPVALVYTSGRNAIMYHCEKVGDNIDDLQPFWDDGVIVPVWLDVKDGDVEQAMRDKLPLAVALFRRVMDESLGDFGPEDIIGQNHGDDTQETGA